MASIYQAIHAPVEETPPCDEQDGTVVELGADGYWRAYDTNGHIATAPNFYALWERMGNHWN